MNSLVVRVSRAPQLRSHVGGKAANLGALMAGGFSVPEAFVVTTAAFNRFVGVNGLEDELARATRAAESTDLDELRRAADAVRTRIMDAAIASEIRGAIRTACARLDGASRGLAVRSSAVSEDAGDASFAGLLNTFLNVCGEEALLDAVKARAKREGMPYQRYIRRTLESALSSRKS